jgi:redox-sensitive bicupin YhaK (pirin superfamily)
LVAVIKGRHGPFLHLGEASFSLPGFNWHRHRGLEAVTVVVDARHQIR